MRRVAMIGLVVSAAMVFGACGGGSAKPAPTTTTSPPPTTTTAPPATLTVVPASAPVGTTVTLTVAGAKSGDTVTFKLTSPKGKVFTGTPRVVDATGGISATYNSTGDEVGVHTVQAVSADGSALTGTLTLTRS